MRRWYKCQGAAKRTISRSTPFNHTVPGPKTKKPKMKSFFVVALLVAAAVAAPQRGPDADAVVVKQESNVEPLSYNYGYDTSNGISAQEQGQLNNVGSENEILSVRGSYSYTGPDGVVYSVTYLADENGFQPQGAHLPVGPQ